jgi:hypothetical protein
LQKWLIESLIPDSIARQVLGYLTQFAGKASKLGSAGLAVLFFTALALILTIDRTLNGIWRVRKPRPLGQRVLVYWAGMTLGAFAAGSEPEHHVLRLVGVQGAGGCHARWGPIAAGRSAVCTAGLGHGCAVPLCAQHPGALVTRLGGRRVCVGGV